MKPRRPDAKFPPTRHTVLIGDVLSAWEKLFWDVEVFTDLQRDYPEEDQPLVYSAINACISSWSLENWALSEWIRLQRRATKKPNELDFRNFVRERIPVQSLCCDVANTAKHASYRDSSGVDAELKLRWSPSSEYEPGSLILLRREGEDEELFHNDMYQLHGRWWEILREAELVSGNHPTPRWWSNKVARAFGSPELPVPKHYLKD